MRDSQTPISSREHTVLDHLKQYIDRPVNDEPLTRNTAVAYLANHEIDPTDARVHTEQLLLKDYLYEEHVKNASQRRLQGLATVSSSTNALQDVALVDDFLNVAATETVPLFEHLEFDLFVEYDGFTSHRSSSKAFCTAIMRTSTALVQSHENSENR